MKPIEDLNISPWPWGQLSGFSGFVIDGDGDAITDDYDGGMNKIEDARMTAAAPELYEALYAAELELSLVAPAARCLDIVRSALAKAAGEEAHE